VEIVSEPDMRSPREAFHYLKAVRRLVTYLGVCDGNMEEGSLRCDANVSVRKRGARDFGTKTEVKNMNSFRNVERAIEFEIRRQVRVLEEGGRVNQETLLWDANQNVAVPMRSKERVHDYRYFPDPDLVPVVVSDAWIGEVRRAIPETPRVRRDRFQRDYGLSAYDSGVLTAEKEYADYFEQAASFVPAGGQTAQSRRPGPAEAKAAANWVMTEVLRLVADRKSGKTMMEDFPVTPSNLGSLIGLVQAGTISSRTAKEVFAKMVETGEAPSRIVESLGLTQISDEEKLRSLAREIVAGNAPQVEKFRAGNTKVMGFFVGEIMKATRGKANPELITAILTEELNK
jgi:aspartyl-tRNA(Asn)/glutamyl-tRNA(Gln) amidotransferase subunit B